MATEAVCVEVAVVLVVAQVGRAVKTAGGGVEERLVVAMGAAEESVVMAMEVMVVEKKAAALVVPAALRVVGLAGWVWVHVVLMAAEGVMVALADIVKVTQMEYSVEEAMTGAQASRAGGLAG